VVAGVVVEVAAAESACLEVGGLPQLIIIS